MAIIYHKHHIIPRHMGGTDDPSNIVVLTVEEHAEAHRLLWEQYGREEDFIAWRGLAGITSKEEHVHALNRMAGNKTVELKRGIHDPSQIELKQLGGRISAIKQGPRLRAFWNNKEWMTDGHNELLVHNTEFEQYLSNGWSFGRTPGKYNPPSHTETKWVHKAGKNKRIPADQLQHFLHDGWTAGMFSKK